MNVILQIIFLQHPYSLLLLGLYLTCLEDPTFQRPGSIVLWTYLTVNRSFP